MSDWLKNLKPGDKVIVNGYYARSVETFEKYTPAGRIVVGGRQFDKYGHSGGTSHEHLEEATQKAVYAVRMERLRRVLSRVDWKKIADEQVLEVGQVLGIVAVKKEAKGA